MREYDITLSSGERVRIHREDLPNAVVLIAEGAERVIGRAELLRRRSGASAEISVSLDPDYGVTDLGYRLGAVLMLSAREAGLKRVYAPLAFDDAVGIELFRKLGAIRAHFTRGSFVQEIPVEERSSVPSGTWNLAIAQ